MVVSVRQAQRVVVRIAHEWLFIEREGRRRADALNAQDQPSNNHGGKKYSGDAFGGGLRIPGVARVPFDGF